MPDIFPSLAALEEHLGKDAFHIRLLDRNSKATIIAPHGGYIDAGTSVLAHAIAGKRYNLFDFQGLRRENSYVLHVTSTRFRHPRLQALLDKSRFAVSVHCMGNTGSDTIYLGGLNKKLKATMLTLLRERGFHVDPDSPKFRGVSPRNVVNLPPEHGVQIEMPSALVETLYESQTFHPNGRRPATTKRFDELASVVRTAIRIHLQRQNRKLIA